VECAERWAAEDARTYRRVARPYLAQHLDRWPDHMRLVPPRLKRAVTFDDDRLWWMGDLARALDWSNLPHRDEAKAVVKALLEGSALEWLTVLNVRSGFMRGWSAYTLVASERVGSLRSLDLSYNQLGKLGIVGLVRAERLHMLETLRLEGNGIKDRDLQALWDLGTWPALNVLHLAHNRIGPPGARTLAGSGRSKQLTQLGLAHNDLGDDGAAQLGYSPHLGMLRLLDLSSNGIGEQGALALAASGVLGELRELVLDDNLLGQKGVEVLSRLGASAGLERLSLCGARAGGRGLTAMLEGMDVRHLRHMALARNPLGDAGARALAGMRDASSLESLDLARADLGPAAMQALGRTDWFPRLRELRLSYNTIGDRGLAALLSNGRPLAMERLFLDRCALGDTRSAPLARAVFTGLAELDLESNVVSASTLERMLRAPWAQGLHTLRLRRCGLDDRAARVIAACAASMPRLRVLDLGHNAIGRRGARARVRAPWHGLEHLGLAHNDVDDRTARILSRSPWAHHLRTLDVMWCPNLGPRGVACLQRALNLSRCDVQATVGARASMWRLI